MGELDPAWPVEITPIDPGQWRVNYKLGRSKWLSADLAVAQDSDPYVVYFVQAETGGPVKIGYSVHGKLKQRLSALQTGNPQKLVVRLLLGGGRELEAVLHDAFSFARIRQDGEWFSPLGVMDSLFGTGPSNAVTDADLWYYRGFAKGEEEGLATGWQEGWWSARRSVAEVFGFSLDEFEDLDLPKLTRSGVVAK